MTHDDEHTQATATYVVVVEEDEDVEFLDHLSAMDSVVGYEEVTNND